MSQHIFGKIVLSPDGKHVLGRDRDDERIELIMPLKGTNERQSVAIFETANYREGDAEEAVQRLESQGIHGYRVVNVYEVSERKGPPPKGVVRLGYAVYVDTGEFIGGSFYLSAQAGLDEEAMNIAVMPTKKAAKELYDTFYSVAEEGSEMSGVTRKFEPIEFRMTDAKPNRRMAPLARRPSTDRPPPLLIRPSSHALIPQGVPR